jgi:hypothetical protein
MLPLPKPLQKLIEKYDWETRTLIVMAGAGVTGMLVLMGAVFFDYFTR